MNASIPNSSSKIQRSASVGRPTQSVKSILGNIQSVSFKQLKRRSSKVELNKLLQGNPRLKRKKVIKNNPSIVNGALVYSLASNQLKFPNNLSKKQFALSSNPVMSAALKQFTKPEYEKKESLYGLLEKSQKLSEYLQKFRKPANEFENSKLWTQKVSDIQKTINTSVYNTGIISRMLLH